MNPTKSLPETYFLAWEVDMKKDARLNWMLQIIGTLWFVVAAWVLWKIVAILRPTYSLEITVEILTLVVALLTIFITLIFHELIHGLFFWLFTKERPHFGIGPGYAYAAAPDWYFPKGKYLIVGLAPLVMLSAFGLAAIPLIPAAWVEIIFLAIVFNAGGAVGDLYICLRIAGEARDIRVRDNGDGFEIYRLRGK